MTEETLERDGLTIAKLPPLSLFSGDVELDVTPIEQFYAYAVGLARVAGGSVYVDIRKVFLCPQDAETLYSILRRFLVNAYGAEGANQAAHMWRQVKPRELRAVPQGHVVTEAGCLYIKPSGHVIPRVAH